VSLCLIFDVGAEESRLCRPSLNTVSRIKVRASSNVMAILLVVCSKVSVMAASRMSVPLAVVVVLSVLLTGAAHAGPEMDPYKILGVTRSASLAEIKKVYKRLAKEW